LEGEGCFILNHGKYPSIILGMTSGDTVTRASNIWRGTVRRNKTMWLTQVNGTYAIAWMMTLFPFLGKCRQDSVTNIIKFWKEYPYQRASNGLRFMATCHPDKVSVGSGLCRTCYMRQWREKKLLRSTV